MLHEHFCHSYSGNNCPGAKQQQVNWNHKIMCVQAWGCQTKKVISHPGVNLFFDVLWEICVWELPKMDPCRCRNSLLPTSWEFYLVLRAKTRMQVLSMGVSDACFRTTLWLLKTPIKKLHAFVSLRGHGNMRNPRRNILDLVYSKEAYIQTIISNTS